MSKYSKKLHVADFMPGNLEEIKKWVLKDAKAHNWNIFTESILEHEGQAPAKRLIAARENQTRRKIAGYSHLDLKKSGKADKETALLVSSFFVADSATKSKKIFKKMTKNAFDIVQPGGVFVATYLGGCKRYRVGNKWLNSAEITKSDIREVFDEIGAKKITVKRFETPEMAYDGFDHIFAVIAER